MYCLRCDLIVVVYGCDVSFSGVWVDCLVLWFCGMVLFVLVVWIVNSVVFIFNFYLFVFVML